MKTRREGNSYIIYDEESGSKFPYKVNRYKTDKSLKSVEKALRSLTEVLRDLYNNEEYDIYHLVADAINYDLEIEEGRSWKLDYALNDIRSLRRKLTEQDEIPSYEQIVTVEDLGYKLNHVLTQGKWLHFEKIITDNEDVEVIRELRLDLTGKEPPMHRERTIEFEKFLGESVQNITYRKVRISQKLQAAIDNTVKLEMTSRCE